MHQEEKHEVKVVQATIKNNQGFRPIKKRKNKMVSANYLNHLSKMQLLKDRSEIRDWLNLSLKEYLLIKKSHYLNRRRKIPTDDDIFKCDCISSLHATK